MARFLILRTTPQAERKIVLDLVKEGGGRQVEPQHPLGTVVECTMDIADALELMPVVDVTNI